MMLASSLKLIAGWAKKNKHSLPGTLKSGSGLLFFAF
jgi:hypothetical protein